MGVGWRVDGKGGKGGLLCGARVWVLEVGILGVLAAVMCSCVWYV